MNDQNESADISLSTYINLEMPKMQKKTVEQGIRIFELNGFVSLLLIILKSKLKSKRNIYHRYYKNRNLCLSGIEKSNENNN